MGVRQSKAATTKETGKSGLDDKATRYSTAAAFRAIDTRNVNKLQKALTIGAKVGTVQRSSGIGSDSTTQTRSMSLLEYAVDKNFLPGVDIMLKVW